MNNPQAQKGSDELREKQRQATINRYKNMSDEQKADHVAKQREGIKRSWDNLTEEERVERMRPSIVGLQNMSDEQKAERNRKISEAKQAPNSVKYDPTRWVIPCNNCEDVVKFDNYNNFQNTKSRVKKGQVPLCQKCKESSLKYSKNPDDWKVPCTNCGFIMVYDNYGSFITIAYKINDSKLPHLCPACIKDSYKDRVRKDRIYSRNPEDWKLPCSNDGCERTIVYKGLKGYQRAAKLYNEGCGPHCFSCVSKRADRTKEEYLVKLRGRKLSLESILKMKESKANWSVEKRDEIRNRMSDSAKKYWDTLDSDTKKLRIERLLRDANNPNKYLTPEEIEERTVFLKSLKKERAILRGSVVGFVPRYNFDSIPYIDTILSEKYNTSFIHAENGSEFRIYDPVLKKNCFADAYSPELNLWIEFDERHKFKGGILREKHVVRHNRIREILNCNIVRFYIFRKSTISVNVDIVEYYNDLIGLTDIYVKTNDILNIINKTE